VRAVEPGRNALLHGHFARRRQSAVVDLAEQSGQFFLRILPGTAHSCGARSSLAATRIVELELPTRFAPAGTSPLALLILNAFPAISNL